MSASHKHKHSKADLRTEWSEWLWDEPNSRWYRARRTSWGEYEYQYRDTASSSSQRQTIPHTFPHNTETVASHTDEKLEGSLYQDQGHQYPTPESSGSSFQTTVASSVNVQTGGLGWGISNFIPAWNSWAATNNTQSTNSNLPTSFTTETAPHTVFNNRGSHFSHKGKGIDSITSLEEQLAQTSISAPDMRENTPYVSGHLSARNTTDRNRKLDRRYVVVTDGSRFFKIGRVFKVLWAEPAGGTGDDDGYETSITVASYGEKMFSKVRTFVVIREAKRSCQCLPMHTYGGKGTSKYGVESQDHAAVYQQNSKPLMKPGETMIKEAFPVIVEDPREKIDPMTRLDFGKIYTVEHNVKVLKVGRIPNEYHQLLRKYYVETMLGGPDTGISSFAPKKQADSSEAYPKGANSSYQAGSAQSYPLSPGNTYSTPATNYTSLDPQYPTFQSSDEVLSSTDLYPAVSAFPSSTIAYGSSSSSAYASSRGDDQQSYAYPQSRPD